MSSGTVYCYHCHTQHPREEMRLVVSKSGKRWRCIRSIEATQKGPEARAEFGRRVSEMNTTESKNHARRMNELPQIGTVAEAGFPDMDFRIWMALLAPACRAPRCPRPPLEQPLTRHSLGLPCLPSTKGAERKEITWRTHDRSAAASAAPSTA